MVQNTSLTKAFIEKIERKILSGELKIGDSIPSLREMSETYGISRSVVNVGINDLISKGYLISSPRKNTVVADWKVNGTLAVLSNMIEFDLYDKSFIQSIIEAKSLIFSECAALAAIRRTEDNLVEIKNIINEFKDATIEESVQCNIKLSIAVAKASKNNIFVIIVKSFESTIESLLYKHYKRPNVANESIVFGRKLVDAIEDKNPEMAKQMVLQIVEIVKKYTQN